MKLDVIRALAARGEVGDKVAAVFENALVDSLRVFDGVEVEVVRTRRFAPHAKSVDAGASCEGTSGPCEEVEGLRWEDARTSYPAENCGNCGKDHTKVRVLGHDFVDPNQDVLLCRGCAEEHHTNWDAQWNEYYSGLL